MEYSSETREECLDEVEDISVFVVRKGNPVPLITTVIKMPVSESVIVLHVYSIMQCHVQSLVYKYVASPESFILSSTHSRQFGFH